MSTRPSMTRKLTPRQRAMAAVVKETTEENRDSSVIIPPSDSEVEAEADEDDESPQLENSPNDDAMDDASSTSSSPEPHPRPLKRIRRMNRPNTTTTPTPVRGSQRATASTAAVDLTDSLAATPALAASATTASRLFDRAQMMARVQQMKQSLTSPSPITISSDDEEKREEEDEVIERSDGEDAADVEETAVGDDHDSDGEVVVEERKSSSSVVGSSGWRTRQTIQAEPKRKKKGTSTSTKSKKSNEKKRGRSSSDEEEDRDDSEFEIESTTTKSKSNTKSLKEMFQQQRDSQRSASPTSSQPHRYQPLVLTTIEATTDSSLKMTERKLTPKKRYRSLVPSENDDEEEVIIVTQPIRAKSVHKRPKFDPPSAAPGKLKLTKIIATPTPIHSTPPVHPSQVIHGPPSILWIDKYAPRYEDELCVHSKKVAEVKLWLQQFGRPVQPRHPHYQSNSYRSAPPLPSDGYGHGQTMLILSGPAGSGKSAMIRVLAASLGYSIVAWEDTQSDAFVKHDDGGGFSGGRSSSSYHMPYESKLSQFRTFLSSATRYSLNLIASMNQLQIDAPATSALVSTPVIRPRSPTPTSSTTTRPAKSLIVIEEFPFAKEELKKEFLSILLSVLPRTTHPIIFILTTEHESKSSEHTVENQFSAELLMHPQVQLINCNPISDTGLKQALARVIEGEGLDLPESILNELRQSCHGDIRHAIHALQFQSVPHSAFSGTSDVISRPFKSRGRNKKTKDSPADSKKDATESESTQALFTARDETFSIFHSVGKILYAKTSEARSIDMIIESSDTDPLMFLEWIYSNYIEHLFAPVVPKTTSFMTAGGKPLNKSTAPSSIGSSASHPVNLTTATSTSLFDDDDDIDGAMFDQAMESVGMASSSHSSTHRTAAPPISQSTYDDSALAAMVEATQHFSDADILAGACSEQYGDSQHAVESIQAAEVGCRGYMLAKRSCAWVKQPPEFRVSQPMRPQSGPLSTKMYHLQRHKHDLFHALFIKPIQSLHKTIAFDEYMPCLQSKSVLPFKRQGEIMRDMKYFLGRDFLLPAADTFVEQLPYLFAIATAIPMRPIMPTQPQQPPSYQQRPPGPSNPASMPPPATRGAYPPNRSTTSSAGTSMSRFNRASPLNTPRAPPYQPPAPSPTQLTFLRLLNQYHLRSLLDQVTKEQQQAFEQLQQQIKRAEENKTISIAVLPELEVMEELEEIESFD